MPSTRMLETQADIEVIGAVESGFNALNLLENGLNPDIMLADLSMPGMHGIGQAEDLFLTFIKCKGRYPDDACEASIFVKKHLRPVPRTIC